MRPLRSVSVLVPTWQGIRFLGRALQSLAEQELALPWELYVVDSGSTDGTWELVGRTAERFPVPLRRERIEQVEFDHGDTRNLLAARSRGDLLVFLTQDAIPIGRDWLARLVRNFDDPRVGAAYCRNVPRPDAELLTRLFSEHDPGYAAGRREARIEDADAYRAMGPHERRLFYNFNDVASAVRRELWERHPFPRTAFGEDVLMARALLEAGFTVVYDDKARVEHSHDYSAEEWRARSAVDARFNVEWLGWTPVPKRSDARWLARRQLRADRAALAAAGLAGEAFERELAHARRLRLATFLGGYEGGRPRVRRRPTRLLDRTELSILYVVHGFPPEVWAGTEVYTANLAREMRSRGHRVTILARSPGRDESTPEFQVDEDEFDGLRVLRMTHRLRHANLRESYHKPAAEAAFRKLLLRERFDLVHFQHLIHGSAGMVEVAKSFGLPTIVHCHDYWALCARVQLIRPDGVRCERNMGSGCFLCVKERGYGLIPRVAELDRTAGPLFDKLVSEIGDGPLVTKLRRRSQELADLRAREKFVVGAYAAADLRISPSRFLRKKLVETAGFDAHSFLYSDNGMRTDHVRALEKRPDPQGRVRFGFVGSLVWYKGGEVMVQAMRRIAAHRGPKGERAVLNVYGDFRPREDEHHARLEELARGAPVRFLGRFDNARLSDVYAEIDVLVVPSLWFENSPITIHEAFLTRTPVLASGIGGMAEFVRDGVDGLHFAVGDAQDLAAKMRRFLDEPDLVERLSRDFPRVKTIAENAEELEFRYRALCCVEREPDASRLLLELAATDTSARYGPVEPQGADMLLLRPGGAAVEYDIDGAGGGRRELGVSVFVLAREPDLEMRGRVWLDLDEVGELPLVRPDGRDETRELELTVDVPRGARRLRIEPAAGEGAHLRIERIRLREARAEGAAR